MKARLTVITLGVENVERAFDFYHHRLGLPSEGILGAEGGEGGVAFFPLQGGLQLAIWARASLAADADLPLSATSPTSFSLGHNLHSRDEVDAVMAEVERAGARVVKPAQETFWGGYAGYFQDPDGHLWEVVWNPDLLPPE